MGALSSSDEPTRRHAHFDCFSGAAGDMILAACLDIGGQSLLEYVSSTLKEGLPAVRDEFSLQHERVWRGMGQIAATHVTVKSVYGDQAVPVPHKAESRSSHAQDHCHEHTHSHGHQHHISEHLDHDHDHLHGHTHSSSDRPSTAESSARAKEATPGTPQHCHAHDHLATTATPPGPLRNLPQIRQLLQDAPALQYIPAWVRRVAISAFELLAAAEAHVHGAESPDAVHFHEVGAVDSIVDTIGSLLALHALGVSTVSCSPLPLGQGTVRAAHGLLPVPAPATLFLLKGLPVTAGPPGLTGELVTPTGAALLRALLVECGVDGPSAGRPPRFTLQEIGIGAGTKDFVQHPNILRVMVGDSVILDERKQL